MSDETKPWRFNMDENEELEGIGIEDIDIIEDLVEIEDTEIIEDKEVVIEEKPKDKITHALIKQKQANKELKARLEQYEQQSRESEQQEKRQAIFNKYIEKGYDEQDALEQTDKLIDSESIKATVEKLEFLTENSDILARYPEARQDINKLIKLKKTTGWDLAKICQVEYTSENSYDAKIRNDQESQLKKKRSVTPSGGQTPIQSIKLDDSDERAYQFYAKKNPGVSRKQYSERLNNNKQTIPHDRWD